MAAVGGTLAVRWMIWMVGRARGWGRKAGHFMPGCMREWAAWAQGGVSTERSASRGNSTCDDGGGEAGWRKGGHDGRGGARGGTGGVYGHELGDGRHRRREREGGEEETPRGHHIAETSCATVTTFLCHAQEVGRIKRFLEKFKPGTRAISQEDIDKQKEAQSKHHMLLIPKSGGSGIYQDSKHGNKTRQSLIAALGAKADDAKVDDPRIATRQRAGSMDKFEYLAFTTNDAGLQAMLKGKAQAEFKGVKYVKYFSQGGDDKEDRGVTADCVVAKFDDFLGITGAGIKREHFQEQDPGEVVISARITMDHHLDMDSGPVRELMDLALAYVLNEAMLVKPGDGVEATEVSHWTATVEGMRASTEMTSVGGRVTEMQHGMHALVRFKWNGPMSEMDAMTLAAPTSVMLPQKVVMVGEEVGLPEGEEWRKAAVVWTGEAARTGCLVSVAGAEGGMWDGDTEQTFYVLGGLEGVEALRRLMEVGGSEAVVKGKDGWQRGGAQARNSGNVRRRTSRVDDAMTAELIDCLGQVVAWKYRGAVEVCALACRALAREERLQYAEGGKEASEELPRRVGELRATAAMLRGDTREEPLRLEEGVWQSAVCGQRGGCEGRNEPCKLMATSAMLRARRDQAQRWQAVSPQGERRNSESRPQYALPPDAFGTHAEGGQARFGDGRDRKQPPGLPPYEPWGGPGAGGGPAGPGHPHPGAGKEVARSTGAGRGGSGYPSRFSERLAAEEAGAGVRGPQATASRSPAGSPLRTCGGGAGMQPTAVGRGQAESPLRTGGGGAMTPSPTKRARDDGVGGATAGGEREEGEAGGKEGEGAEGGGAMEVERAALTTGGVGGQGGALPSVAETAVVEDPTAKVRAQAIEAGRKVEKGREDGGVGERGCAEGTHCAAPRAEPRGEAGEGARRRGQDDAGAHGQQVREARHAAGRTRLGGGGEGGNGSGSSGGCEGHRGRREGDLPGAQRCEGGRDGESRGVCGRLRDVPGGGRQDGGGRPARKLVHLAEPGGGHGGEPHHGAAEGDRQHDGAQERADSVGAAGLHHAALGEDPDYAPRRGGRVGGAGRECVGLLRRGAPVDKGDGEALARCKFMRRYEDGIEPHPGPGGKGKGAQRPTVRMRDVIHRVGCTFSHHSCKTVPVQGGGVRGGRTYVVRVG